MALQHQHAHLGKDIGMEQNKLSTLNSLSNHGVLPLDGSRELETKRREALIDHAAMDLSDLKLSDLQTPKGQNHALEDELAEGFLGKLASFGDPESFEGIWKDQEAAHSQLRDEILNKEAELLDSKRRLQDLKDELYTLEIGVPAVKQACPTKKIVKNEGTIQGDSSFLSSDDEDNISPKKKKTHLFDDTSPDSGSVEGQQLRKLEEAQRLMEMKAKQNSEKHSSFVVFQQEITLGLIHLARKLSIDVSEMTKSQHRIDVPRILKDIELRMQHLAEVSSNPEHARPSSREGSPQYLSVMASKSSPSSKHLNNSCTTGPSSMIKPCILENQDFEPDTDVDIDDIDDMNILDKPKGGKNRRHTTITTLKKPTTPTKWRKGERPEVPPMINETETDAVLDRYDVKKSAKSRFDGGSHVVGKRGKRTGSPAASSPLREDEPKSSSKHNHAERVNMPNGSAECE